MKINSHNEWDTLKEIIVGRAEGTVGNLSWLKPGEIPENILQEATELAKKAYPKKIIEEVIEDLDNLSEVLKDLGVVVHRPTIQKQMEFFGNTFWQSNGNNCYNARDLNLVVGDNLIESPSMLHSRYFETQAFYEIFYEYYKEGFNWISPPKPLLNYDTLVPLFRDESERVLSKEDLLHKKLTKGRIEKLHKVPEKEILFEAANTVRMGKDLLYLVSSSGNYKGANWLQSVIGDKYKVHVTKDIYRSSHIDSTVMCLKPGMVLLNNTRVNENNCPKIFEKWDKIWFGDVAPTPNEELEYQKDIRDPIAKRITELGFKTNLFDISSPWIGLNFLSVNQETVLVEKNQKKLIKLLEDYKFTVVPITMRHMYTFSGGIHCVTLDTVRKSKLESYF